MTSPETQEIIPPYTTGWRLATIICVVLLAVGTATGFSLYEMFNAQITHLQGKLKNVPQTKYIAVLLDARQNPGMLVTFDPQDGFFQLQRLTDIQEGPDDSMQLWDTSIQGQPRSLGVLTPRIRTAQLPITEKALAKVTHLSISVENRGGAEAGAQPLLPYLYSGALIQKAF